MRGFFIKIFTLLLFVSFLTKTYGQFQFRGRVILQNKEHGSVNYKMYKNSKFSDSTKTSANGAFMIKFELNNVYLIEFSKTGFTSKKIIVDTKVPEENNSEFYDRFSIIKLDITGKGDTRSLAGLPVVKYYYKVEISDFAEEKITGKTVTDKNVPNDRIKTLKNELLVYQAIIEQQKIELGKTNSQSPGNVVIEDANRKADSILAVARGSLP